MRVRIGEAVDVPRVPDARNIDRPVGVDTTDKEAVQITRRRLKSGVRWDLLYYKLAACTKLSHTDPWDY